MVSRPSLVLFVGGLIGFTARHCARQLGAVSEARFALAVPLGQILSLHPRCRLPGERDQFENQIFHFFS